MGYTKRQIIDASLEEIGLDPIEFDISSREYQRCARRLDALMASWKSKGIDLGYSVIASPEDIDIDAESNIADYGWQAVFLNLALSIAPTFGKQPLNETKANAKDAYSSLLNTKVEIKKYAYPNTFPKGSGNKPFHTNQDNYFTGTGTTSTSSATSTTVTTDYLDGVFKKNDVIIGTQGGVDAKLTLNTTPVDGVGSDILFGFDAVTGENKLINPKIDLITNAQTGTFEKDDIIFAQQGGVSKKLSINSTVVNGVSTDKIFAFDGTTNQAKVITPSLDMLVTQTGTLKKDDSIVGTQGGVRKDLSLNTTPVNGVVTDKLLGFDASTNEAKLITPKIAMIDDADTILTDRSVRVSSNDTTPSHLEDKLLVGTGLSLSTQNDGGNETRTIDLNIESSGTWTPVFDHITLGTNITINTISRAKYKKIGKLVRINCLLNLGTGSSDEIRMTIPFNAEDLQLLGTCWTVITDASPYTTQSEVDDVFSIDGVPQTVLALGNAIARDGYLYFKDTNYGTIAGSSIDENWLYITATYTTA